MTMNKFLLIAGNNYDSCHGLEDYAGTYDTLDEALEAGDKLVECDDNNIDWYQILDCNDPTGYYSNDEHIRRKFARAYRIKQTDNL
jgi:hypothetical protein